MHQSQNIGCRRLSHHSRGRPQSAFRGRLRRHPRLRWTGSGSIARRDHPDLVILDIQMPEMDGYTACDEILALEDRRPTADRFSDQ